MKEPASIWFETEYELKQLCLDAQSQAKRESDQDFSSQMAIEANQKGLAMSMSFKQLEWLCRIADWDVPRRRT